MSPVNQTGQTTKPKIKGSAVALPKAVPVERSPPDLPAHCSGSSEGMLDRATNGQIIARHFTFFLSGFGLAGAVQ